MRVPGRLDAGEGAGPRGADVAPDGVLGYPLPFVGHGVGQVVAAVAVNVRLVDEPRLDPGPFLGVPFGFSAGLRPDEPAVLVVFVDGLLERFPPVEPFDGDAELDRRFDLGSEFGGVDEPPYEKGTETSIAFADQAALVSWA